jgi:hypothetical protein
MNETESKMIENQVKSKFYLPLVNYTRIRENLGISDVAELFPRWAALSKAFNPLDKKKHTSAYMVAGVKL